MRSHEVIYEAAWTHPVWSLVDGAAPPYYHLIVGVLIVETVPPMVQSHPGGGDPATLARYHRRPLVGASHARFWSPLFVLGAILWAFIAKN